VKIGIKIVIGGIVLVFAGLFYTLIKGNGFNFGSLDGITISSIGAILVIIGMLVRKMKKISKIKQAYEDLDKDEKD
jgi:drug/metabolite transporter (DMT)-like permease